jgi:hypothetical protein
VAGVEVGGGDVPSENARKANWHQNHRVGAFFGTELHSKTAAILPKQHSNVIR